MAGKNTAVFGIYKSVAQAERAVDTLTTVGFANNDISVLLTDAQTSRDFAHQKNTKAPEGAATGVAANLYMTFRVLQPARTPRRALGQLYMGQLVKVALTVALFMLAARMPHVSWPALLSAYLATLVVFWWVPFAAAPRTRIGSRG